jgi:hypothetical protein
LEQAADHGRQSNASRMVGGSRCASGLR